MNTKCTTSEPRGSQWGLITITYQKAKNLTVKRQTERAIFTVNPQRTRLLLAVEQFQGLSNLTISAAHLGLLALKEFFLITGTTGTGFYLGFIIWERSPDLGKKS